MPAWPLLTRRALLAAWIAQLTLAACEGGDDLRLVDGWVLRQDDFA